MVLMLDLHPDFSELLLDDFCRLRPYFIPLVRDDLEGERLSAPVQDAVAVRVLPACLSQKRMGLLRIVGYFLTSGLCAQVPGL